MTITFPSTKAIKDEIRGAIGQTVTFVLEGTPTACPVCSGANLYDGVNEASLNPYCATCDGKYWLDTGDVTSGIVAHVRWTRQDEPDYTSGGEVPEGDCSITIDINSLSAANIVKIKEVRADSRRLQVHRVIYRGVPTRDRVRFVCREWGKE
jgi:hypothetical protein